jgi:hypothetical protein
LQDDRLFGERNQRSAKGFIVLITLHDQLVTMSSAEPVFATQGINMMMCAGA